MLEGSQTADGEAGLGVGWRVVEWAIRVAMQADENGGHHGTGLAASGGSAGQIERTAAGVQHQEHRDSSTVGAPGCELLVLQWSQQLAGSLWCIK